jgi:hypothetical protein
MQDVEKAVYDEFLFSTQVARGSLEKIKVI